MNKILLVCLFLTCSSVINAQNIKGLIRDSTKKINLNNASVLIINEADSLIQADVRTVQGNFIFNNLLPGNYILIVTYPKYVDYVRSLKFDQNSNLDLGEIYLTSEAILLNEVTISAKRIPIKIRGDTTEFDAKSYHLQPNATVEDLLKKLQGFQVDRYGNITAQGKQINRVLVDGEEFFGDDPTLVTKSLRADMIDKVQLFDKKSNQAAFTGINDGKSVKTVNLKLKKESKVGDFGKIDVGLGTHNFYQIQALYNHFNNEEKFALYGFSNNTGVIGLSRREQNQYSEGSATVEYMNYDLDSWNGDYSGKGIPKSIAAGSHYNNIYREGKLAINLNYNLNRLKIDGDNFNVVQENLPNTSLITNSSQRFDNNQLKQNFNGEIKLNIDSTSSIALNLNAGITHKETYNEYNSVSRNIENILLNTNSRTFSTSGDKKAISTGILYLKKLNKERRTLSVGLDFLSSSSASTGNLVSKTIIKPANGGLDSNYINQLKRNNDNNSALSLKIGYTEPISKSSNISANFGVSGNSGSLNRSTYDVLADPQAEVLNSLLSSNYQLSQFTDRGGLIYHFSKNKVRFQAGTDIGNTRYNQKDLFTSTSFKRNFVNYYPSAEFSYDFSSLEGVVLKYNGSPNFPSLDQLQPVINNNDPLNIFIGNVNLNPSFTHRYSLNYIAFKKASDIFINVVGNIEIVNNPITSSVTTDSASVSTYTYANLLNNHNLSYSASFSFGGPLHIANMDVTLDGSFQGNKFANIVNDQLSLNRLNIYSLKLGFGKAKDNLYNLGINFGVIYNSNHNNLQPQFNNNSWGYTANPNFDFYLPKKITFHTEAAYLFQGKTINFPNDFSRIVWNSYLQKDFRKDNDFSLKLTVNDILNQNRGFDRFVNQNFITQNTYTTIRRYFMLSFIWNFKKFKASNKNE